jgi:hypothetical protein
MSSAVRLWLADGADRLGEALHRMLPRHVAGVEMDLRGMVIVAGDEAEQDFGEETPFLRPEPSHDAEVDRDQFAVGVNEQIAGMHVGVEESVAQRVAQEALDHVAAERRQIEALGFERGAVVERRAVDPFQRQHLARGAVPVHRRHPEILVVARILRHLGQRCGLQTEIHFHRHRAGKCRHRLDRAQPLRLERDAFRLARDVEEGVEIGLEAPLDAGAQDFHRHRLARAIGCDLGAVHLRDRSGGDRRAEARIDLRKRLAERGGDGCFRFGLRERRHLVLQALKIARDLLADHVGAGGHELAELDVSRAEPGEGCGEPALAAFGARPLDQPGERDRGLGRQRQRPRVDQREHALAREHESSARQAGEM